MHTLRITRETYDALRQVLLGEGLTEVAAFLIAGYYRDARGYHFTVREIMIPKGADFDVKEDLRLQVSPIFFNRVISRAEALGLTVVMAHSHPFSEGEVQYSCADDYGEGISSKTLHDCLGEKPSASLLFGQNSVAGRVWMKPGTDPQDIGEIRILGEGARSICLASKSEGADPDGVFARQIAIYGKAGQEKLSQLRAGIVGLGGTGSAVAEQLVRLGVRHFILVDRDVFEDTNVTRLYGSNWGHVRSKKKPKKVQILEMHLKGLGAGVDVDSFAADVIKQSILEKLSQCDLVFSCTDRHAPRSVLNELAYQYFIPVVDVGVGVDAENGILRGGSIRATLVGPGFPCMYCYGIVRPEVIAAELLPMEERRARQAEGYVPGLVDEAPAVVHLTTLAASLGVTLAIDNLFRLSEKAPRMVMLDLADYSFRRLSAKTTDQCVCRHRLGRAQAFPLSAPA